MMFGDTQQIPPIPASSALFLPPIKKKSRLARDMLAIFWEDGPDAINYFKELTIQVRVEDAWYSAFLKECRNGQLSEEMYNFLMGFPTLHAGSWMSNGSEEGQVTCGHADCQKLPTI